MELKPGYKQTEVGVIPEDWEVKTFKDGYAESSRNGIYKPAEYQGRGTRIVNMGELFGLDFISDQDMNRVELSSGEASIAELRDGDLLFGRRSVVPSGAGKCSLVVKPSTPLTFESSIIRVRLDKRRLDPLFHYYFFSSSLGKKVISGIVSGTNIKGIRASELRELKIPRPPLADQYEVAQVLRDVDDLIASMKSLITKKHQAKQAAMQELLTGKRRLPGFGGEWEVKRLGDVLSICHGKSQHDVQVSDGPYPILATGGQIGTAERPLHSKPSVLIGRKGTINKPQYMDTPFWTVDTLFYSVMKDENNARFFYYLFCTIDWMRFNEASGVPSLNARTIENIEVNCPAPEEQNTISSILSEMDEELAALEARKNKAQELKQGMMQQLLAGRIRLL
jgi:type I restriction enzyme S subunit